MNWKDKLIDLVHEYGIVAVQKACYDILGEKDAVKTADERGIGILLDIKELLKENAN